MAKSLPVAFLAIIVFLSGIFLTNKPSDYSAPDTNPAKTLSNSKLWILKDVGEAYMDNFGLKDNDFKLIKEAGIDVIEGNFDICASDSDVSYFLDKSTEYGIKVIMPAGAGEAEWGYECDQESYPETQTPLWNKDKVVSWINKWKGHPAIYAWDISNEAGSTFPNVEDGIGKLSLSQLQSAYKDVKSTDPTHPVMIRMNGWFFYDFEDNFFREGNPFGNETADIVMVNAYSNVEDYYEDFVATVSSRAISSLLSIDPDTRIIIALGSWKEPPLWYLPTEENITSEINYLKQQDSLIGIGFFKYGARGSEWYLPDPAEGAPEIWSIIKENKPGSI